ncbi:MAG: phytanoyl-CoA dioxygenase family protein [Pirellulaceae bacterium]|nr:phytanoyl-CoA dioxygenase family protein [Pirellulaceae bacterium]
MHAADRTLADQYAQQGFAVVEDLLSDETLARLRQRTQDIAEGLVPEFPSADIELEPGAERRTLATVRKLNRCAENDSVFLELASEPSILDVIESLIGPDIKLYASQCFMKPPGGIAKPYHQDSAYFTIEPPDLVTCWAALDDVTLDNGCMWVIPGSHRGGLVGHARDWLVGDRVDMQVPLDRLDLGRELPVVMPAGSCSFHHSLLLHRSAANLSDRSRRGLAVHYMSARSRWTDPARPQPAYRLLRGREFAGCV